jgi:hypothetical protein
MQSNRAIKYESLSAYLAASRAERERPQRILAQEEEIPQHEDTLSFLHHSGLTAAVETYIAKQNTEATQTMDAQDFVVMQLLSR